MLFSLPLYHVACFLKGVSPSGVPKTDLGATRSKLINLLNKTADTIFFEFVKLMFACQYWFRLEIFFRNQKITKCENPLSRAQGTIFICNHRSHFDVFVLLPLIPGLKAVSKKALNQLPVFSHYMKYCGHVFFEESDVRMQNRIIPLLKDKLHRGQNVLIFPEMTRANKGQTRLSHFGSLAFQLAKASEAPIQILTLSGTDRVWPKGKKQIFAKSSLRIKNVVKLKIGSKLFFKEFNDLLLLKSRCKDETQSAYFGLEEDFQRGHS